MRSYIFTASERRMIKAWLVDHGEDKTTQTLFHEARRNFASIRSDIELYSKLANALRLEGRFTGRVRLRAASRSRSPSGG